MRNYSFITIVFLLLFCLPPALGQQNNPDVNGTWNGTASYSETFTGITGTSERHVNVTIVQNKVAGSHSYKGEVELGGIHGTTNCQGVEGGELHILTIRKWDSTYDIHIISPACSGTSTSAAGSEPYGPEQTDIIISNKKYNNPNILSGSETTISELPGDMGKVTRTITWSLTNKPIDVELIVTPEGYDKTGAKTGYDDWLPEPGNDELTKGNVMTISLKLRGKDGKPLKVKAKSFELRLSNTSKEPGITINYPLSPRANQLPDLRFLPASIAESIDEDQFISITCNDGSTGQVNIASYDGGGWTTLTCEAILQDDTRIKGYLLNSRGEEDILIPKRIPGTKIALAWSKANGNPKDVDDKDTSKGNKNNGDGLTAYEEYRGVISEGQFKRLNPQKKELGVLIKQSEKNLFAEGFSWFSKASGIDVILFGKNEIPDNRRLNQNAFSAHDFKQYVLRITKGHTGDKDIYGYEVVAYGITYPTNDIPARVTHIVIDADLIHANYLRDIKNNPNLPYSEKDVLANTIAHEMGHGVGIMHHGNDLPYLSPPLTITGVKDTQIYVYPEYVVADNSRPFTINERIGLPGNQQCGDIFCVMCYNNRSYWVKNTDLFFTIFYFIPEIAYGKNFCSEQEGTGINERNTRYGDAINGKCLGQIKLRE